MTNVDNSMSIISNDNTTELVEIYKGKYFSKQRKAVQKEWLFLILMKHLVHLLI